METFIIIVIALTILAAVGIFISVMKSEKEDETPQEPKFQPRKITIVNNEVVEKPKRKYKRRSKKKPVVAENAPTEKKTTTRSKKSN
jgi:flagellar basal body-associated protein FliL